MVSDQFANKPLFKECIDALQPNVVVLSIQETNKIFELFEVCIPIINGGSRIDWEKISKKKFIDNLSEILPSLRKLTQDPIDKAVYVLWNNASLRVIKTDLESVLNHFDDVTCLGFETWLFNPYQGYIIEYYYLGEMNMGLISKASQS